MSEFNTLEDIDLQLLQLHLLAVCVLVKTVDTVPDDGKSRNFCDDDIGCGSVFVRTLIFVLILSLVSRFMLNDDRRRAFLSKLPILKMSVSSAVMSFFVLDDEHSPFVDWPFSFVAFGLHIFSLVVVIMSTVDELLLAVTDDDGVGDNFSYSRTVKSFKLRNAIIFVLLVDVDAVVDAVVLRLLADFNEPEQRHLCELFAK